MATATSYHHSSSSFSSSQQQQQCRCFICGSRIGRGNQTSLNIEERMDKLISVSQTVEHSSTIISDILSRILNETVMREETICKICFNLLNDIDYHLKEAQEKTDDITNKFLDKEKDPLSYKPHQLIALSSPPPPPTITASRESSFSSRRRPTRHTTSNKRSKVVKDDITSPDDTNEDDDEPASSRYHPRLDEETELVVGGADYSNGGDGGESNNLQKAKTSERDKAVEHVGRKSRRGRKRNSSPVVSQEVHTSRKMAKLQNELPRVDLDDDTDDTLLTEDEMSVNTINKNKAKLFSHILNPKNKGKSKEKDLLTNKGRNDTEKDEENKSKTPTTGSPSSKMTRDVVEKTQRNNSLSPKRKKTIQQNSPNIIANSSNNTTTNKRVGRKQPQSVEFVATTDEEEEEDDDHANSNKTQTKSGRFSRDTKKQTKENIKPQIDNDRTSNRKSDNFTGYNSRDNRRNKSVVTKGSPTKDNITSSPPTNDENPNDDLTAPDLVTVNMDDLTDLLYTTSNKGSKGRHAQKQEEARQVFFARKSEPNKGLKSTQNYHQNRQKSFGSNKEYNAGSKEKHNEDDVSDNDEEENGATTRMSNKSPRNKTRGENSVSTCPLCDRTFKIKTNLQLHLEKVHNQHPTLPEFTEDNIPETHKCNLCTREFTNEKSLTQHKEEHAAIMLRETENQKSPITGTKDNVTKKEEKSGKQDSSEVKATCPQCNQTFRRKFNMTIHIDRVHNKIKNFKCKICEKSFATNSDLKQHMVTHGQGRTFPCEMCDRVFTNRDSIILHRKQHTKQKTHFCSICNKGFYKQSCLSRHQRSHTGERPFQCEFCKKAFSQSTSVKAHKAKCSLNPDYSDESIIHRSTQS